MPPTLAEFLQALAASVPATLFRSSTVAYATLNAIHIFSLGLLIGSIATLDLRLLGFFRNRTVYSLAEPLTRVTIVGIYFAALSGFLLFSVRPIAYAENPAFLIKVSLVGLGLLNTGLLHSSIAWRNAIEEDDEPVPDPVRAAALRSLLIWAGAVLAGRWIGFLQ